VFIKADQVRVGLRVSHRIKRSIFFISFGFMFNPYYFIIKKEGKQYKGVDKT